METPESFQSNVSKKAPTYTERKLGKWALILVISGVVIPLLIMIITDLLGTSRDFGIIEFVLLGVFLIVVGLAIGIVGRKSPLGKAAIITSAILLVSLTIVLPFRVVKSSNSGSSNITVEYSDSEHQEE